MYKRSLMLNVLVVVLASCGPIIGGIKADKGALAVEGWVGGPFVQLFDAPVPIPLAAAGVRYGLAESTDLGAHLHLTPLAMGVGGVDVDLRHQIKPFGGLSRYTFDTRLRGAVGYSDGETFGTLEAVASVRQKVRQGIWLGGGISLLHDLNAFGVGKPTAAFGVGGKRWSMEARALFFSEHHNRNPLDYALTLPMGTFGLFYTYGWQL